ncbi:MAG: EamA family transporter [Ilumatobacteraceae bacterium]
MAILLAALCAATYGVADYCGGRAARSLASTIVTLIGQMTSLVLVIAGVLVFGTPVASAHDLWWGAAGGAAGGIALIAFYTALSRGAMTVVAPTTAIISAVFPVIVGLWLGERPSGTALVGIVVACLAVALVSGVIGTRHQHTGATTIVLAALAGVGFGFIFIAFARTANDSGMWPLVAARAASLPVVAVVVGATRPGREGLRSVVWIVIGSGVLDMAANLFYLEASHRGLLSIVAVISSMYPVSTVCLAFGLDHERVSRTQAAGLVCAATALALVSLGS